MTMRTVVLALACLACVSYARRVAFNPAMPGMQTNPGSVVRHAPMMSAAETGVTRREALAAALSAGAALAAARPAVADPKFPVPDAPKEVAFRVQRQQDADALARSLDKLKVLNKIVKSSKKKAEKKVKEDYKTLLEPLQKLLVSNAEGSDSPVKAKALLKAEEMKGHMVELALVLEKGDWTPYVSKSTGKTYTSQVERELEEITETTEEWFKILLSVPPPKDNFQMLKQAPPKVFPGGNALIREAKGF
mmetsp:Transcript_142605/g.265855  ORF Transcript_142605/g.265855 Transcript_142605/m.265855 type:complete len:249 (-) Transcript_142605:32-778(-)